MFYSQITCDAIKILGNSASLVLDEEDIKSMSDVEIEDCAEVLGSLELDKNLRVIIWRRLKEVCFIYFEVTGSFYMY